MRGLWLENGALELRDDLPRPRPRGDEALVRVLLAGICNTDLELQRGYYPFSGVPGHEFVGVVEQGPAALCDRRVVGEINIACGGCALCRRGLAKHCENRKVLGLKGHHGAFAEYLTLPAGNLHAVADELSTAAATFVEPLAAALEIQERIDLGSSDRVLVVGHGKLGRLIAMTLALTPCQLQVVGRETADSFEPGTFDIAIECTGNVAGFAIARRALRPRGTLVLKSTYAGDLTLDAATLVVDEITVLGSRCGPFSRALELLAEGAVEVESLIEARLPLAKGLTAFDRARRQGAGKILLDMADKDETGVRITA